MTAEAVVGAGHARSGPLAALCQRNFLPYFVGNLLSSCGTWFHNIAQTLLVYRLTGSLFLVGVVNLAQFASVFVLGGRAGVAADRYDRRKLLVAAQTASALVSGSLALLAALGHVGVVVLVCAALLLGAAQTFSTPAMLAVVPQLVPPEHLAPAVALNIVTLNVARAVGPVLGAIVVDQLGPAAAFGLNSLSFLALIVGLSFVRSRPMPRRVDGVRLRLVDTLRTLPRRPEIGALFVLGTCASMTIDPVTTLSPDYATQVFGRSDTLVGWFVGCFGFGAVLAGLWVSRSPRADDRALALRTGGLVVSLVLFASTGVLAVAVVALVGAGFCFISTTAAALARVQSSTDHGEHGRLMALWSMAFMGSRPIASVIDGGVASLTDVRVATYLIVLPSAVAGALMWTRARAAAR